MPRTKIKQIAVLTERYRQTHLCSTIPKRIMLPPANVTWIATVGVLASRKRPYLERACSRMCNRKAERDSTTRAGGHKMLVHQFGVVH